MTLGQIASWFDNWKKITGGVVALVTFIVAVVQVAIVVDGHWVKTRVYGPDVARLRGQINYQTNELKLGQIQGQLEVWTAKLGEFQTRPITDQQSPMGRDYRRDLEEKISSASSEAERLRAALAHQKDLWRNGR